MEALFVLIPISLGLAGSALICFVWATRNGQFSDLKTPAERIICEDFELKFSGAERSKNRSVD